MKKRLFALFLSCVMTAGLLSGCGGNQADDTADTGEGGEEWPATTIQYININSESMGSEQVQAMVQEFNETNGKNITVEFNFVSANYPEIATEVQSYLVAGQDVGVVQVGYAYINYFADNFPQMQDINEVISTYFPEDSGFLDETYGEAVLNLGYALNGDLAGLAYGMSTPLLFYNADMCREAGLDPENPPTTWEEVGVWAKAIRDTTGNYGFAIQNPSDTWSIIPMFLSAGKESIIQNNDGVYSADLYSDDTVAAWTMLQDYTKEGLHVQLTLDEAVAAFAGGQLGMMLTTSGRAAYFKENCSFDVQSCMQPTFEGHDLNVCIGGNVLSIIGEDEAQIKASWEFIKFLLQPENIGTWCEATGYLPPTKNAEEDPAVQAILDANHLMAAAVAERDYAAQWTSWPGKNGLQVDQYLVNMRDSIMSNFDDVATAIQTTEDTINELLAE